MSEHKAREANEAAALAELKVVLQRLLGLLDDAHPGLATWRESYASAAGAVLKFYGVERTAPDAAAEEGAPVTWGACPHCKLKNPGFLVNMSGGGIPGIGNIQYLTYSCESCKGILSVSMLAFAPDAAMAAGQRAGGGRKGLII